MERQGAMFMTTLSLAVNGLSSIDDIRPAVQALGDRHFTYGVKPGDFQPFGRSFIWALEHHLGDKFSPELKSAWTEAFDTLSAAMLAALGKPG
jgi:nitric oxide dioxygenase